jgi:uncharacterized protein (DUF1778 family)
MPRRPVTRPGKKPLDSSPLMVRIDAESKSLLVRAAKLRRISVSDYVRTVMVPQAQKEVEAAYGQTIALTADEQLALWTALSEPPRLTSAQKKLAALMRGES